MNIEEIKAIEHFINYDNDLDVSFVFSILRGIKTIEDYENDIIRYYKYNQLLSPILFGLFLENHNDKVKQDDVLSLHIEFDPSPIYGPKNVEVRRIDYEMRVSMGNINNAIRIIYKWPDKDVCHSTHLATAFCVVGLGRDFVKFTVEELLKRLSVENRPQLVISSGVY